MKGCRPRFAFVPEFLIILFEKERDMPGLQPEDKAPDFTIIDLEGKHHRLYDYLNG